MCAASSSLCREWKLKSRTWRHQRNQLHFFSMETTYAIIFAHKGKSNTSFGTVKGLLLCLCTHNINKMSCFYLEQEHFTKMNRKCHGSLIHCFLLVPCYCFDVCRCVVGVTEPSPLISTSAEPRWQCQLQLIHAPSNTHQFSPFHCQIVVDVFTYCP